MSQEIDLSPRKILSYLVHLERKLPRRDFHLYQPSVSTVSGAVSDELLAKECRRMLDFVGLENYRVEVSFASLEAGTSGNISLNDNAAPSVCIQVADTHRSNWAATLATLAHEICHKLLFVNDVYSSYLGMMNEVYVDLSTLYVGFGELILQGYTTTADGSKHLLGYLTMDTYHTTSVIVAAVRSDGSLSDGLLTKHCDDPLVLETLDLWRKHDDKTRAVSDAYVSLQRPAAERQRNLRVLRQLLERYEQQYIDIPSQQTADRLFGEQDADALTPVAAFAALYEYNILKQNALTIPSVHKNLEAALYSFFCAMKKEQHDLPVPSATEYCCPRCGRQGRAASDKTLLVHCPCGHHFVVETHPWNPTQGQRAEREREQKQVAAQKSHCLEAMPCWLRPLVRHYLNKADKKG